MQNLIITKLADLQAGDRILSWDGRPLPPGTSRRAASRLHRSRERPGRTSRDPHPTSDVEHVLYPSQMDGRRLEVERP